MSWNKIARFSLVSRRRCAGLFDRCWIGRLAMDHQGRWPSADKEMLPAKIGECGWRFLRKEWI